MPLAEELGPQSPALVGTAENPARDPKAKDKAGRGSIGDKAFTDAVTVVIVAWVLLLLLWYSLRHHNV